MTPDSLHLGLPLLVGAPGRALPKKTSNEKPSMKCDRGDFCPTISVGRGYDGYPSISRSTGALVALIGGARPGSRPAAPVHAGSPLEDPLEVKALAQRAGAFAPALTCASLVAGAGFEPATFGL